MKTIYFTTPIYYVNSEPHLGHAYTAILADMLTRFYRQRGYQARMLTGTDEHGERIQQAAAKQGISPIEFCDRVSAKFRQTWPMLEVVPDDFIRTTEKRHQDVVIDVLNQLWAAGEIYKGEYRGLYCLGCERYLTEKELVDGRCPDHLVAPKEMVEENYMFRMEKHREWLKAEIEANPEWIQPERYRSEVLAMLREPIGDLSISRPKSRVSWGIPLPFDADHVLYVWFDALFNYATALGRPGDPLFEKWWPYAIHLIGKDIVKPHAIFWPIMLRASGYPLYAGLRAHGYWLADATKMSKSLGNVIRPKDMVDRYGVDAFRYFLMRDMVFGNDADVSELAIAARNNADLANDLGNLLSRVLTMIGRYTDGKLPAAGEGGPLERALVAMASGLPERVDELVAQFQVHAAVEEILQVVRKANQYVQESQPWAVAKDPARAAEVGRILYHAAETLRLAAVLLSPIIPTKSAELLRQLGVTDLDVNSGPAWERAWGALPVGNAIVPGEILFPKIDLKELAKDFAGPEAAKPPKPARGGDSVKSGEATTSSGGAKGDGATSSGAAKGDGGVPSPVSRERAGGVPLAEGRVGVPSGAAVPAERGWVAGNESPAGSVQPPAAAGEGSGGTSGTAASESTEDASITIDDFAKVRLRVAEVLAAEPVPKAKKLLKLTLRVGSEQRTVVSGIADHYQPDQLIGKKVVVVANLKPVVLRGVESQGMILAAEDADGHLSLVSLDRDLPSGGTVR